MKEGREGGKEETVKHLFVTNKHGDIQLVIINLVIIKSSQY